MFVRLAFSLLTLGVAIAFSWKVEPNHVRAGGSTDPLPDTDGDFLPDCVEWAVLTNASTGDTDGDDVPDFVEVVQRGQPRRAGAELPTDQELRIVVTGSSSSTDPSWLHLLLRVIEPGAMTSFAAWLELPSLPGVRLNFDMLAMGVADFDLRNCGPQGLWVRLSVPMVSMAVLRAMVPCTIQVESIVGGRYLRSGVQLFDVEGTVSTLVPFDDQHFAVQSIAPIASMGGLSNRVCLLDLLGIGSGPGGTAYLVQNAFCDDCNEVECAPNCTDAMGWIITVPGGLGVLGSSN